MFVPENIKKRKKYTRKIIFSYLDAYEKYKRKSN